MGLRFCVLASGSSGNSSLLVADGFGVLIDAGLTPRLLSSRLAAVGHSWGDIQAVVLTHTHGDHWNERILGCLLERDIALYCHADHHSTLNVASSTFGKLGEARLVHDYEPSRPIVLSAGVTCTPFLVQHDDTTCGFRFDAGHGETENRTSLGYAADLGCWDQGIVKALADVDILALEFNHDIALENESGRSPELLQRVLGDHGHLSNDQAADLLREVLQCSRVIRPRHLVQLHLSRQCNRAELAVAAAYAALKDFQSDMEVHTAHQYRAGPCLNVAERIQSVEARNGPKTRHVQEVLPGWE